MAAKKNRIASLKQQIADAKEHALEQADALESIEYELDHITELLEELKELS